MVASIEVNPRSVLGCGLRGGHGPVNRSLKIGLVFTTVRQFSTTQGYGSDLNRILILNKMTLGSFV